MLQKLREKPHHIKQSISLALTLVIFSGILFVWVSSRDARSRGIEVREKTVSPVDGVSVMFDGFLSGLKDRTSSAFSQKKEATTATSTDDFDISGVVIIDPSLGATTKK
ncbi:MAG: hypothetical protein WAV98_02210 [Minisyncoccia bacterium]